jgi:N-acetylneuraminate synthase/N,N'-diacetyllegionaminate synthase
MILEGRNLQKERLLVAEIGNNHEGDGHLAMEMVAAAAEAGADAVKVQVIVPERLVHASQSERIAQLTRFRLPHSTFAAMAELARAKGLLFIATPFDPDTLTSIVDLVSAVKIASGDLDYIQLLTAAARTGKPVVLSTGMGTLGEVRVAIDTIARHLSPGKTLAESLALLHCISAYPTPLEEANLRTIETLKSTFGLTVGYSDHTLGIEAAIIAAILGARIIEKHFTLDKTRTTFRDHTLSADPAELGRLATVLHSLDSMLGDGEKRPMPCEQQSVVAARRSAVAVRDLPAGACLSLADLDFVRPRTGLPPAQAAALVGRSVRVPLKRHEFVSEASLELGW